MPWPNGFASRCKFATCVQVASRLATLLSRFVFNSDDLRLIWRSSNSFSTRCKFFTVLPPNAIYAWNLPILPLLWENWALMDRTEVLFPWNCKKTMEFFSNLISTIFLYYMGELQFLQWLRELPNRLANGFWPPIVSPCVSWKLASTCVDLRVRFARALVK